MVPSAIAMMPSLPRTSNGKLDRRALPEVERQRVRATRPYIAPRTLLEQFLADIWCEVLGIEKVGVEDTFFELGGNSIQAAQLISRLQDKLGQRVQLAALFNLPDIVNLARYLGDTYPDTIAARFGVESLPAAPARRGDEPLDPADLVIPLQTTGEHPPLFMVHPPGGIVICYQALAYHLGSQQPLYAIRSRGLHTGEPLPTSLEAMAAEYVAAIRTVQPNGTYHLGGWSLGGVIAYEMAQQLLADNQEVGFLAMLDTTIPFGEANRAYASDADNEGAEYGIDMSLEDLAELDAEEQLPYLIEHVRNLGLMDEGAPNAIVWQMIEDLKNLFHTHVRLATEYALQPYPGTITMFRPMESPVEIPTPPDRGWGQLVTSVDVQYAPGQHHTMVKEPHVEVLARRLSLCLQQAFKSESAPAGV
jgi:thioesterase domain-containing protein